MLRITLRSLWDHKRRLVSTVVAVVLGVAFMAGTLMIADTIDRTFDDLFSQVNEGVAVQVQGVEQFSSPFGGAAREQLEASLVDTVRAVEGVAAVEPFVQVLGFGANNRLLDPEGEVIGSSNGPPTLIESWIDDETLNPYTVTDGRAPASDTEVALNAAAVDDAELELGDTLTLLSQLGRSEYELVGVFTFGRADSAAGAISADFTLAEVQRIADLGTQSDQLLIAATEGVDDDELTARVAAVLPDTAEALTGEEAAAQQAENVTQFASFFSQFLLVFAGIALVVGIFIIYNTFSILVAQRTRELALLRTLGASRSQVLRSVITEALVTGVIAAGIGLVAGIGLASGSIALLRGTGFEIPSSGLTVSSTTVTTALVTGLLVTVLVAVLPAIRATRVAPLAALRDVAIDRSGASRVRIVIGALILLSGAWGLAQAWRADGDTDVIPTVGFGALQVIVGAIVIGPVLAGPSIRVLGIPLRRFRGITGNLAVENSIRSPKRTSLTASALIIGVALIGFIAVFSASAKASVTAEVDRGFLSDFVVQAESSGFGPPSSFSPTVADQVSAVDGVASTSSLGFFQAQFVYDGGDSESVNFLTTIEPDTIEGLLGIRMAVGDVTDLTEDGVLVDRQVAEDTGLAIGDEVTIIGPGGGSIDVVVQGISDDTTLLGFWAITRSSQALVTNEPLDAQVAIALEDGADPAVVRAAIEEVISPVPGLNVLDDDDLANDLVAQINVVLNLVQGLLLLSVFVAMVGIANTLSLSVQERTRELGLLRAVGMSRSQVRRTIRYEAILIAILGSIVGIALGIVLSRAIVESLTGFGLGEFRVPVVSLVAYAVIAALLAVLSSILPARRAAKLDVLDAIGSE